MIITEGEVKTSITLTKEECQVLLAYASDYVPVILERQRDIYRNLMYRMNEAVK